MAEDAPKPSTDWTWISERAWIVAGSPDRFEFGKVRVLRDLEREFLELCGVDADGQEVHLKKLPGAEFYKIESDNTLRSIGRATLYNVKVRPPPAPTPASLPTPKPAAEPAPTRKLPFAVVNRMTKLGDDYARLKPTSLGSPKEMDALIALEDYPVFAKLIERAVAGEPVSARSVLAEKIKHPSLPPDELIRVAMVPKPEPAPSAAIEVPTVEVTPEPAAMDEPKPDKLKALGPSDRAILALYRQHFKGVVGVTPKKFREHLKDRKIDLKYADRTVALSLAKLRKRHPDEII
jgi:hypothetical protein